MFLFSTGPLSESDQNISWKHLNSLQLKAVFRLTELFGIVGMKMVKNKDS